MIILCFFPISKQPLNKTIRFNDTFTIGVATHPAKYMKHFSLGITTIISNFAPTKEILDSKRGTVDAASTRKSQFIQFKL